MDLLLPSLRSPCQQPRQFPHKSCLVTVQWVDDDGSLWVVLNSDIDTVNYVSKYLANSDYANLDNWSCFSVDDVLCALDTEDNCWYRAKVVKTDPLKIQFIDFGNFCTPESVAILPPALTIIQPLAIQVRLAPNANILPCIGDELFITPISAEDGIPVVTSNQDRLTAQPRDGSGDATGCSDLINQQLRAEVETKIDVGNEEISKLFKAVTVEESVQANETSMKPEEQPGFDVDVKGLILQQSDAEPQTEVDVTSEETCKLSNSVTVQESVQANEMSIKPEEQSGFAVDVNGSILQQYGAELQTEVDVTIEENCKLLRAVTVEESVQVNEMSIKPEEQSGFAVDVNGSILQQPSAEPQTEVDVTGEETCKLFKAVTVEKSVEANEMSTKPEEQPGFVVDVKGSILQQPSAELQTGVNIISEETFIQSPAVTISDPQSSGTTEYISSTASSESVPNSMPTVPSESTERAVEGLAQAIKIEEDPGAIVGIEESTSTVHDGAFTDAHSECMTETILVANANAATPGCTDGGIVQLETLSSRSKLTEFELNTVEAFDNGISIQNVDTCLANNVAEPGLVDPVANSSKELSVEPEKQENCDGPEDSIQIEISESEICGPVKTIVPEGSDCAPPNEVTIQPVAVTSVPIDVSSSTASSTDSELNASAKVFTMSTTTAPSPSMLNSPIYSPVLKSEPSPNPRLDEPFKVSPHPLQNNQKSEYSHVEFELGIIREQNRIQMLQLQQRMDQDLAYQRNFYQQEMSRQLSAVGHKLANLYAEVALLKNDFQRWKYPQTNPTGELPSINTVPYQNPNSAYTQPLQRETTTVPQFKDIKDQHTSYRSQNQLPGLRSSNHCDRDVHLYNNNEDCSDSSKTKCVDKDETSADKNSSKCIFVRGLTEKVTLDHLFNVFGHYGNVEKIKKLPNGLANVEMSDEAQAAIAIRYLNNIPLMGGTILVKPDKFKSVIFSRQDLEAKLAKDFTSRLFDKKNMRFGEFQKWDAKKLTAPCRTLYLKNVMKFVSNEKIKEAFAKHELNIQSISSPHGKNSGSDEKKAVFVNMNTLEDAVNALAVMHQTELSDWARVKITFGKRE